MPNSDQQSTARALPGRLHVSIGGHFGPSYGVKLENGRLTYTHLPATHDMGEDRVLVSEEISPSADRWQAFRAALDRLGVWSWQEHYTDPKVCDGTGWSAEIVYADQSIDSGGSNCFPDRTGAPISITQAKRGDTFDQFCSAVSELAGRKFR
jgi:hypothetical protein